jgi:hypothetical protein
MTRALGLNARGALICQLIVWIAVAVVH